MPGGESRSILPFSEETMRVDNRQPIRTTTSVPAARRDGVRGFSLDPAPSAPTHASAPAAAATLAGLDAVLLLQADAETPHERRRRAARRGHDLLDGLDRLKAAILGGRVGAGELRAVAARLAERAGPSGDPRLDGLMAEIELRTAVELAKLERRRGV